MKKIIQKATFYLVFLTALSLQAEEEIYDFKEFNEPLNLTRGFVSPNYTESFYLENDEACRFAKQMWGWVDENCQGIDAFLVATSPNIDTIVVEVANSDGYVKHDEWESSNKEEFIEELWEGLKEDFKSQSERLNSEIKLIRWLVYPTFIKDKNFIYFAYLAEQDGVYYPNIVSSILDREGHVKFLIIPANLTSVSAEKEFQQVVETALDIYTPYESKAYADYQIGDKIAEYGIFGLFAALAGIKWGKAVATGIIAALLVFAKKFWWVVFLPIFYFIRRLFVKDKENQ